MHAYNSREEQRPEDSSKKRTVEVAPHLICAKVAIRTPVSISAFLCNWFMVTASKWLPILETGEKRPMMNMMHCMRK